MSTSSTADDSDECEPLSAPVRKRRRLSTMAVSEGSGSNDVMTSERDERCAGWVQKHKKTDNLKLTKSSMKLCEDYNVVAETESDSNSSRANSRSSSSDMEGERSASEEMDKEEMEEVEMEVVEVVEEEEEWGAKAQKN